MKVLLITYYFPPMGGAGVQRGLKFSKYLPLAGVQPIVIAADDPHYVRDDSLAAEVPEDLEVHRVSHTPWLARLAARRRAAVAHLPPRPAAVAQPSRAALRDAVLRAVRAVQFPDAAATWARRALTLARRVVAAHAARGEPIELVFSSSPPVSAHAVAERIADEFGLPWIADFRDLWTDNPGYDAPAWRRRVDRRSEQRWLARADGVVTVTPSWQRLLQQRRHGAGAGADALPVAFIPNGYDEEDFAAPPPPPRERGVCTLVHTGTFYGPRDPHGLLGGLARYLDGPRTGDPELRVRLVGNIGARFGPALHDFSVRYPGVLVGVPFLPHAEALAELRAADALLLVVGGGRGAVASGWLPGKIFEYLRSGKPVLTLGDPQGDAAQLIAQHGRGVAMADDDAAGIAQALQRLIQAAARKGGGDDVPASARRFERRELSRQLADFMRDCRTRHAARTGLPARGVPETAR